MKTAVRIGVTWLIVAATVAPWARADRSKIRFEKLVTGLMLDNILQDRDGFMWFATQTGLVRYDGYEYKAYYPGPDSVPSHFVSDLHEDRDGLLWVGTHNGLCSYDKNTDTFTLYRHDPDDPDSLSDNTISILNSQAIAEDAQGGIWVGTSNGLDRFDKQRGGFSHYKSRPDDITSILDDDITAVLTSHDGSLWIGSATGLHRFDPTRGVALERYPSGFDGFDGLPVSALHEDRSGKLWIGTRKGGLYRLDPEQKSITPHARDIPASRRPIFSMLEDHENNLWVTTFGGGLFILDSARETITSYLYDPAVPDPDGIGSNDLLAVYMDRQGTIWICGIGGVISKVEPIARKFETLAHRPGDINSLSSGPFIGGMIEDSRGAIWIAMGAAGVDRYDRTSGTFTHYLHDPDDPDSLPEPHAQSIIEDSAGNLWVATINWIILLDRDTGKVVRKYPVTNYACSPIEDRTAPGIIWYSSTGAGLIRFDTKTGSVQYFASDPQAPDTTLSGNMSYSIEQADDGMIWVAHLGEGLDVFDPRQRRVVARYRHDPDDSTSVAGNVIYQVYWDSTHTLWIASDGGLDRFDPESDSFEHFTGHLDGLPSAVTPQLLKDDEGFLWAANWASPTLIRLDPRTRAHKRYEQRNGLEPRGLGGGFKPLKTRDGQLWFYLSKVTHFHPARLPQNLNPPEVHFTSLSSAGRSLARGITPERVDTIHLGWRQNEFEFQVAALGYRRPEASRYRYILEGVDSRWYEANAIRVGRYVGLPGGTYKLKVEAANEDDVWSQQPAVLTIVVESPPWRRWWAWLIYGGLALLILFVYGRYLTRRLRKKVIAAQKLGRYTLLEKIGEGGMGRVYRADHAMLRRPTAIKILPPDGVTDEQVQRFEREVQLTSELNHPNIITIYDYGHSSTGVFYCAMEYLEGFDIGTLIERFGPQPLARTIDIVRQICRALVAAHERGLVHRDIKPGNVFLCQQSGLDVVKVLDFGLVKELERDGDHVTRRDTILGTPAYLSPEAITAPDTVGPAADLYGLGAVAYYLATGQHVFSAATRAEMYVHHLQSKPKPFSARLDAPLSTPVAKEFEQLIMRCLAKPPGARPASAAALKEALDVLAEREPWDRATAERWWREVEDATAMAGADTGTANVNSSDAYAATIEVDLHGRQ